MIPIVRAGRAVGLGCVDRAAEATIVITAEHAAKVAHTLLIEISIKFLREISRLLSRVFLRTFISFMCEMIVHA